MKKIIVAFLFVSISSILFPLTALAATVNINDLRTSSRNLTAAEITTSNTAFLPSVGTVSVNGLTDINKNFSETDTNSVHVIRSWAEDLSTVNLPDCATNITVDVVGDKKIKHIANSASTSDEPEVGAALLLSDNTPIAAFAANANIAPNQELAVTTSSPIPLTLAQFRTGIKLLFFVETRLEAPQATTQSSYQISGTTKININFSNDSCGQNIPPVINDYNVTVGDISTFTLFDLATSQDLQISDSDGTIISYNILSGNENNNIVFLDSGNIMVTTSLQVGINEFTLQVIDDKGGVDTAKLTVNYDPTIKYCEYNASTPVLKSDDTDCDNDYISNKLEGYLENVDTDKDGVPDYLDLDSDNDGIADILEISATKTNPTSIQTTAVDTDKDGIPNFRDLDSDGDNIFDLVEAGLVEKDTVIDGMNSNSINNQGVSADATLITDYTKLPDTDSDSTPEYLEPALKGATLPVTGSGFGLDFAIFALLIGLFGLSFWFESIGKSISSNKH